MSILFLLCSFNPNSITFLQEKLKIIKQKNPQCLQLISKEITGKNIIVKSEKK